MARRRPLTTRGDQIQGSTGGDELLRSQRGNNMGTGWSRVVDTSEEAEPEGNCGPGEPAPASVTVGRRSVVVLIAR